MSATPPHEQKQVGVAAKLVISVLLIAAMGAGVYLTRRGIQSVEESLDSRSWPTTDGVVTHSFVKTTVTPVKKNGREVPNKHTKSYAPDIAYTYTAAGKEFTGTRVTVDGESIGTQSSAQAIVDKYPAHKTIKVSYNPDDPARSLLEPGGWAGSYRWFLPGGFLLLIPLLLFRAIWFYEPTVLPAVVEQDENHLLRPHLLQRMLMVEEIAHWEPGTTVHIRRARVGFLKSIFAGIITGLILGLVLGLLPAFFFLSGRGVIFMAQFYLAVSALLAVIATIGLILWGRRREYLLDWSLESIHWEIGWSGQEAPLESIESLTLKLPARDAQRNPLVDSHRIQALIQGKTYTLLETTGVGLNWYQTREHLVKVIGELAHALHIPWTESHERSLK